MKILVTVHGFLTPSMTFVYNQIKTFESEGHTVKVIANEVMNQDIFPFGAIEKIGFKKDVSYFASKLLRTLRLDFTLYNKHFVKNFDAALKSFSPDIVHVHFGLHLIRVYPAVKNFDGPVITTFHGYDASKYLRDKLYVKKIRTIFSRPNMYGTTVSEDMKARMDEKGIDTSKMYVDYLGVDLDFFNPKNIDTKNEHEVFLQVSNFVEKKGHEFTLIAFSKFLHTTKSEDKILILAGDGPLLGQMKALAAQLQINKNVQFPGLANREQVRNLMETADCFVHHSVTAKDGDMEGLPTVIMEAMAMGLPILSTKHAGIEELVDSEDYGILVEERDIAEYALAFDQIKHCKGDKSRAKIASNFNLKKNTANILDIFQDIK